jgi:hypothetical protein
VSDGQQAAWLPAPPAPGHASESPPNTPLVSAVSDWQDRRTNVLQNFHIHGTKVHPNDSLARQCAECSSFASPPLAAPAGPSSGTKRSRDDVDENIGELIRQHSAHVALLRSFEPDVVSKTHLNIFVPLHKFLAFDPAADRKKKASLSFNPVTNELESSPAQLGPLLSSFVDWSEAYWRLAELSAVFRPASSGSFFKFFQWVTRRLRMGTPLSSIAAYTDAFRQVHAGTTRPLCETDVDILTSYSGGFSVPPVSVPPPSAAPRGASLSGASVPAASPSPAASSSGGRPTAAGQQLRNLCISAKACIKFQTGSCAEAGDHRVKTRSGGLSEVVVAHCCVVCKSSAAHDMAACRRSAGIA